MIEDDSVVGISLHGVSNGWLYYSYFTQGEQGGKQSMHRMRTDGTNPSKVFDIGEGMSHVSFNGEFFFYSYGGLYRRNPDGSGVRLLMGDDGGGAISIDRFIGDWVYFWQGGDLYRVRSDGTDKQQLTDFGLR